MNSVELVDEATGAKARILVEFGLNCYSFRPVLDGEAIEVIWSHPDFGDGNESPSGSGIPLMFPFPGRLRGKTLEYGGKSYDLKSGDVAGNAIHGYVLDRPWRVVEQTPAKLVAQFQASVDDAGRVDCWPADYVITATYAIGNNSLALDVVIENPTTRDVLPFGFGTHPYFRVPIGGRSADQCSVDVPAAKYWELVEMLPSGKQFACEAGYDLSGGKPFGETQLDDVLTDLSAEKGRVMTKIADAASGRTMTMTFDETFGECVVYNPPHREAICIEPITSVPNPYELEAAGIATGLRLLEPGETFRANVEIRVT